MGHPKAEVGDEGKQWFQSRSTRTIVHRYHCTVLLNDLCDFDESTFCLALCKTCSARDRLAASGITRERWHQISRLHFGTSLNHLIEGSLCQQVEPSI